MRASLSLFTRVQIFHQNMVNSRLGINTIGWTVLQKYILHYDEARVYHEYVYRMRKVFQKLD